MLSVRGKHHLRLVLPAVLCLVSIVQAERTSLSIGSDHAIDLDKIWTPATVKRVVDGDTVVVTLKDGREARVALLCVNTEECLHPEEKKNTAFGRKTSAWVKKQLEEGKAVWLQFEPGTRRDYHGILLAYLMVYKTVRTRHKNAAGEVVVGERSAYRNFNEILVENGYSPYYTGFGYSKLYHEAFRLSERQARQKKLGIWSTEESTQKYLRLKFEWQRSATAQAKTKKKPFLMYPDEFEAATDEEDDVFGRRERYIEKVGLENLRAEDEKFKGKEKEHRNYVSSRKSNTFHKPRCRYALGCVGKNAVWYRSRLEALNDGLFPCMKCLPEDAQARRREYVRESMHRESQKRIATDQLNKSTYVSSVRSEIFHKGTCKHCKKIRPGSLVRYKTRAGALRDGKKPCAECRP
jgi:endonuclease YncB( thermonuclease family)